MHRSKNKYEKTAILDHYDYYFLFSICICEGCRGNSHVYRDFSRAKGSAFFPEAQVSFFFLLCFNT